MIELASYADLQKELAKRQAFERLLCMPAGISASFAQVRTGWGPPKITSLSISVGNDYGGDTLVITGSGFTGATSVKIGAVSCTGVTVNSDTQITCTTAAGTASTSAYDVTVFNPYNQGTLASSFTYFSPYTNISGGVVGYRYDVVTTSAGKVTSWTDQFGTNHAIQATSAQQPLYTSNVVNSHSALEFKNGGTTSQLVTTNNASCGAFTLCITFKASGTAGMIVEQSTNASALPGFWLFGTTGWTITARAFAGGTQSSWDKTANWSTDSTWRSCVETYDGTHAGHTLHINNSLQSLTSINTGNPGTTAVVDKIYIGARSGLSFPMTGFICDMALYNSALGSTDRTNADKWFRGRVGL